MLKIQKLSLLILTTLVSTLGFTHSNLSDESYATGVYFGTFFNTMMEKDKDFITYDKEKVLAGIADTLNNKIDFNSKENAEKLKATFKSIDEKRKAAETAKIAEETKKINEQNEKFRADFMKKTNAKVTNSGLAYRIEKAGSGDVIKVTDTVKVHYVGKLANGEIFDSSLARNQPAEFKLNQVIEGWVEGLQLVKKGGKIELLIPAKLAYGEHRTGSIPPNSTLYFEVEVLDVNPKAK